MEKFSKIYPKLKPSIVAIAAKISKNPEFPDIIGTGFIARSDGIIFTNNHVIETINKVPRTKSMGPEDWPVVVLYFHWIPGKGMLPIPLEVRGAGVLKREKPFEGYNYGKDIPDLGFIHVPMRDLPALKIASKLELEEGDEVMLAGFPMGTDTLRAPGWMHQFSPTLQSGIISSILPFSCDYPHAILLNVMTQGGSSGSPVFDPSTGEVIGIEYAGIIEPKTLRGKSGILIYENNTSLTLAIPAKIISEIYQKLDECAEIKNIDVKKFDTIESLITQKEVLVAKPKTITMDPIKPEELLNK